ncbi:hypothetical protein NPIL_239321 [Nephila pilipes]|uniref:Uncharacterized protein n=1 Tax=Nephila pilipes TaxID=299642 RepID=A0A8X6QDG4_NEPPI|nr:hypothetical protein NPIL_239321 [Nephila pilipes]
MISASSRSIQAASRIINQRNSGSIFTHRPAEITTVISIKDDKSENQDAPTCCRRRILLTGSPKCFGHRFSTNLSETDGNHLHYWSCI